MFTEQHITQFQQLLPSLLNLDTKDIFYQNVLQWFPAFELSEDKKKPASNLDCDEALADHHPQVDAGILPQETSSAQLSSAESNLELFPETMLYHQCSRVCSPHFKRMMQQHANDMMEQSNVVGNVLSVDHTTIFMKCMDMYQIKDSNDKQEGFKMMDDVGIGIDCYKHYTGVTLLIEKSKLARYWQYGCQVHENCSFHVSFGYEQNGIILKLKNPYLVDSGIKHCKRGKDGHLRKSDANESWANHGLVSSTHDNI